MICILLLLELINYVNGDLVEEKFVNDYKPDNCVSSENLVAISLWGLSVCKCINKICECKKKIPIKLELTEEYSNDVDDKHYKINITDDKSIKKLKKDLNELKKIIINYEKNKKIEIKNKSN
jgi:hypothetical protein